MLIVEDGTGYANSESFCSVAFADAYHTSRGNSLWAPLDLTVKEINLRRATDYIKYVYDGQWADVPLNIGQALPFPRKVLGLPVAVQQACAELALIAKSTPLMPSITRGKKSVKVGPISVEYDGSAPTATRFVAASLRLAPYLTSASVANASMARLIRT